MGGGKFHNLRCVPFYKHQTVLALVSHVKGGKSSDSITIMTFLTKD